MTFEIKFLPYAGFHRIAKPKGNLWALKFSMVDLPDDGNGNFDRNAGYKRGNATFCV